MFVFPNVVVIDDFIDFVPELVQLEHLKLVSFMLNSDSKERKRDPLIFFFVLMSFDGVSIITNFVFLHTLRPLIRKFMVDVTNESLLPTFILPAFKVFPIEVSFESDQT